MYLTHFGLQEPPFALTPDPRFLYLSDRHREGLAHLLYGLEEAGGFVQLTGEIGTGKTTLCRALLDQLPEDVDAAFLLNPRVTASELLASLCDELGVEPAAKPPSQKALVDGLYAHLLDAHAGGRRPVAIIDEAQNLAPDVLEQLRLLTNLETVKKKLLQIILIGQPELISLLARQELRQLKQRVTARYHLGPFTRAETRAYIAHRMLVAGAGGTIFSRAACAAIHRRAGGVPRLINVYCDRALLGSYVQGQRAVSAATVRKAVTEVEGRQSRSWNTGRWLAFGSGLAAAGIVATLPWLGLPLSGLSEAVLGDATPPAIVEQGHANDAGSGVSVPGKSSMPADAPAELSPEPAGLAEWIEAQATKANRRMAFRGLLALWGVHEPHKDGERPCKLATLHALQCLTRRGRWAEVRALDLPVIVELRPTAEERPRYFTVISLNGSEATLAIDGERRAFPEKAIDGFWSGRYTLVWRPPPLASRLIFLGHAGADTLWLRDQLERLGGAPIPAGRPERFDEALRARVVAFQKRRALQPDGIIGPETLLHLSSAVPAPGTPTLRVPQS
jgi:general secretion pathway protein A